MRTAFKTSAKTDFLFNKELCGIVWGQYVNFV